MASEALSSLAIPPARAPSAGCGAGTRPGCGGCRCRCCAWPAAAAPRSGRRQRPHAAPVFAARRSPRTARRSGRSCPTARCPAPGCVRPGSKAHRRRSHPQRPAAGTAGSRARQQTPPPTSVHPAAPPTATAGTPVCASLAPALGQAPLPRLSTATAVCVALCGSTPMITDMSASQDSWNGPRGHSCFRSLVHVPLSSHPRREP